MWKIRPGCFRAVRFEQRFGFKIGKLTANLIENAIRIGGIEKLAPKRIFTELQLILSEENPLPVIKRLIDLKLLQAIHPEWTLHPKGEVLFGEIRTVLAWFDLLYLNEPYEKWLIYFLALTQPIPQFMDLRRRLGLPKRVSEMMTLCRNEGERVIMTLQKNPKSSRSEIVRLLSPLPIEALLFLMAKTTQETGRKMISLFFTQLKSIRISIGGEELKTLGLVPGPQYKTILGNLLEARINGKVLTREDEIAYVKKHFAEQEKNLTPNT